MRKVAVCVVGALALSWLGLMGMSYAANGYSIILGHVNAASNTTVLNGGFKAGWLETDSIQANDMPLSGRPSRWVRRSAVAADHRARMESAD